MQDATLRGARYQNMARIRIGLLSKQRVHRQMRQLEAGPAHEASRGQCDRLHGRESATALEHPHLPGAGLKFHPKRRRRWIARVLGIAEREAQALAGLCGDLQATQRPIIGLVRPAQDCRAGRRAQALLGRP